MIDSLSLEAMKNYMATHHLNTATIYVVLEYNVELHPYYYYGHHGKGVFNEDEILNDIENLTDPALVTTNKQEAAAYAALEGKTSERYQHSGVWYQRGTAITSNYLVWNSEIEDYDAPWNAPETNVAPLPEEDD